MFIINFKVLEVKMFYFYVLNFIPTDSKCRSHFYFRWVKRPISKLSIVQRHLFRLMKESSKKKARIIFPFEPFEPNKFWKSYPCESSVYTTIIWRKIYFYIYNSDSLGRSLGYITLNFFLGFQKRKRE